ncbi:N-acyl amino acid synthase FeeM domain-containing protein [Rhizobium sp. BK176]|uniref:N-acyl amino acid synthase FeeM domain-containing protein n=1 Tax=Rhizobium sp. BK176 TaxID=2587071 RepID=UPI00216863B8|nr:hypothetical protein [Rhizobium sp. BK176]MCS4089533.1 hypothetical protein [Rhizobium sp. BK176]
MSGGDLSSFPRKMMDILARLEYRRVECTEDLEEVARLRYRAFKANNIVSATSPEMLDDSDVDFHAHVFSLYFDGDLISTVRLHHVTQEHPKTQSSEDFGPEITAMLDRGLSLIDPARFAADPDIAGVYSWLPYMTLRPAIAAAVYFEADRVLQHVQTQHAAFYRRVFSAESIVDCRHAPIYGCDLTLLATDVRLTGAKLVTRFPFFKTTGSERKVMFSKGAGSERYSTVVPTARFIRGDDLAYTMPPRKANDIVPEKVEQA